MRYPRKMVYSGLAVPDDTLAETQHKTLHYSVIF